MAHQAVREPAFRRPRLQISRSAMGHHSLDAVRMALGSRSRAPSQDEHPARTYFRRRRRTVEGQLYRLPYESRRAVCGQPRLQFVGNRIHLSSYRRLLHQTVQDLESFSFVLQETRHELRLEI